MRILLVTATNIESEAITPLLSQKKKLHNQLHRYQFGHLIIDVLVTGVGIPATIYHLTKQLINETYKLVINSGIAGAFNQNLKKGTVVHVTEDLFYDIGKQHGNNYQSVFQLKLADPDMFPFNAGVLKNPSLKIPAIAKLTTVRGITVNTLNTDNERIKNTFTHTKAAIETMESAAFFYVCLQNGVTFYALRGISNYIHEEDSRKWKIKPALESLYNTFKKLLTELNNQK
jgi:futalosine hydrolase